MLFKSPKNDNKFYWTRHVVDKMRYYQISESMIKRIIQYPVRLEEGIAEETFAGMQNTGSKKKTEVWVMFQKSSVRKRNFPSKIIIISAWRYPGTSPIKEKLSIPQDILGEIQEAIREAKLNSFD